MTLWQRLNSGRLILIAGPCVIESEELCFDIAGELKAICEKLDITFIFKASYDKANRSSHKSFRGVNRANGVCILRDVAKRFKIPVLTDVHSPNDALVAAKYCDVLQIPALLCRQTDLVMAAGEACAANRKILNLKKGQFLSPYEMGNVIAKAEAAGCKQILVTERGTTFGYNNLVADMRSIPIMAKFGYPVIFDATHSVQLPGGAGDKSSGQREFAPVLACAAIAAGANGVFVETHPDPDRALSDGPNMIPLKDMPKLLKKLVAIHKVVKHG